MDQVVVPEERRTSRVVGVGAEHGREGLDEVVVVRFQSFERWGRTLTNDQRVSRAEEELGFDVCQICRKLGPRTRTVERPNRRAAQESRHRSGRCSASEPFVTLRVRRRAEAAPGRRSAASGRERRTLLPNLVRMRSLLGLLGHSRKNSWSESCAPSLDRNRVELGSPCSPGAPVSVLHRTVERCRLHESN